MRVAAGLYKNIVFVAKTSEMHCHNSKCWNEQKQQMEYQNGIVSRTWLDMLEKHLSWIPGSEREVKYDRRNFDHKTSRSFYFRDEDWVNDSSGKVIYIGKSKEMYRFVGRELTHVKWLKTDAEMKKVESREWLVKGAKDALERARFLMRFPFSEAFPDIEFQFAWLDDEDKAACRAEVKRETMSSRCLFFLGYILPAAISDNTRWFRITCWHNEPKTANKKLFHDPMFDQRYQLNRRLFRGQEYLQNNGFSLEKAITAYKEKMRDVGQTDIDRASEDFDSMSTKITVLTFLLGFVTAVIFELPTGEEISGTNDTLFHASVVISFVTLAYPTLFYHDRSVQGKELVRNSQNLLKNNRYNEDSNPLRFYADHRARPIGSFIATLCPTLTAIAFVIAISSKLWVESDRPTSLGWVTFIVASGGLGWLLLFRQTLVAEEAKHDQLITDYTTKPKVYHMMTEVDCFYDIAREVIEHIPEYTSQDLVTRYRQSYPQPPCTYTAKLKVFWKHVYKALCSRTKIGFCLFV